MSANTLETFLYKLGNDRPMAEAFMADPSPVLDGYPLSAEERRQIVEWDLHAIVDAGVSPMLLMFGYTAVNGGPAARDQYIGILKAPRRALAGVA